jgi:hypothetical protein
MLLLLQLGGNGGVEEAVVGEDDGGVDWRVGGCKWDDVVRMPSHHHEPEMSIAKIWGRPAVRITTGFFPGGEINYSVHSLVGPREDNTTPRIMVNVRHGGEIWRRSPFISSRATQISRRQIDLAHKFNQRADPTRITTLPPRHKNSCSSCRQDPYPIRPQISRNRSPVSAAGLHVNFWDIRLEMWCIGV